MLRSQAIITVIIGCWVSMILLASGQSDRESEAIRKQLAADTRAFGAAMDRASRPVQERYVETLTELERRAAQKKAYALAVKYRNEGQTLRDTMGQSASNRRERDKRAIFLKPQDAELGGAVLFKDGVLRRWRSTSSLATWNLRSVKPGTYEVAMSHSCTKEVEEMTDASGKTLKAKAGGQIQLSENSNLIGSAIEGLRHKLVPTEDWMEFWEETLGSLKISSTAPSLQITVEELFPLDLMHLQSIRLIPLTESEIETTAETEIGPTPEKLRQALDAAIQRKQSRLRQRHLAKLQDMREEAVQTKNTAVLTKIDQAVQELRKEGPAQ